MGQVSNSGLARWFWFSVISHEVTVKVSVGSAALVSWSCLKCLTERILKFSGILQKKGKERKWSHSVISDSLRPHWHQAPRSMGCSRQEYWMGCHFLLQGIFPTQGLNPGLPHCRQTLYHLSHQGSPKSKSRVQLFATPWAIHSMEFPRPEYWSG